MIEVRVYPSGDDVEEHTQPCVTILEERADAEVWLDTGVSDFDGICIGSANDRHSALVQAIEVLESALVALKAAKAELGIA